MTSKQETGADLRPSNEVLSPEGVEERIEFEIIFRLTLTQGGKVRLYVVEGGETRSIAVFENKERAMKKLGVLVALKGAMIVDPKGLPNTC